MSAPVVTWRHCIRLSILRLAPPHYSFLTPSLSSGVSPIRTNTLFVQDRSSSILLLTTLTSGPNLCIIAAENAAPANNRR